MAVVNWHKDWYVQALAAVSEGFCPEHATPLPADGWCGDCRVWWSISHDPDPFLGVPQVVATYPAPMPAGWA
jgi:hypothetical protein